ncbi:MULTISPECIES: hypothetical protein [unclassified Bradyrhizobium]|uniref:hypothetical protein n=1 Tax=unclassified Bradyrhizobium TaxID=2631580 RepID=UPI0029165DA6|nr:MULTISPECIES: hypothetical protein [unclassified Bradyrhizobium]
MNFPNLTCPMSPVISDLEDIPTDLDVNYEEGCWYIRIPIALSEDGRWLTSIDVGYQESDGESPCDGIAPIDFYSFGYEIHLFDQQYGVSYLTMNPLEARCAIPSEIRHLVIDITCACYLKLIAECDPSYIFRVTWLTEPGKGALKKHDQATETLCQSGYTVIKEGTDQHGCKFWLLGKSDEDHSHLERVEGNEAVGADHEPS